MEPQIKVRVTGSFEGLWYRHAVGQEFNLIAEHDTGYIVIHRQGDDKPAYSLILFEHGEVMEY